MLTQKYTIYTYTTTLLHFTGFILFISILNILIIYSYNNCCTIKLYGLQLILIILKFVLDDSECLSHCFYSKLINNILSENVFYFI